jgi:hypothetical protein
MRFHAKPISPALAKLLHFLLIFHLKRDPLMVGVMLFWKKGATANICLLAKYAEENDWNYLELCQ